MKRVLLGVMLSIIVTVPCFAATAHEQAMSYILADQDTPKEAGDKYYNGAINKPVLMETTAYYQGTIGSHGDRMREGYCAGDPELYGASVAIYEAIPTENGYSMGDFIGYFEMRDTGYGYSTGTGKSEVRSDKKYAGTIESGLHLDIYRDNLDRCWQWMHKTKGKVFAVIVPEVKG